MAGSANPLSEITRIDKTAFSPVTGLRAGVSVSVPLLVGIVTGQPQFLISVLGALFVNTADGPRAGLVHMRVLLVACFTQAIAFGAGTLCGTTGIAAIPLMAAGVFTGLSLGVKPGWAFVGLTTAILFAVGVGLPGGSVSDASGRLELSLLGGLWGLAGIGLERYVRSRRHHTGAPSQPPAAQSQVQAPQPGSTVVRDTLRRAVVTSVTCSLGLAIGMALGLTRDFWVVVTILLALRPTIGPTLSTTAEIVIGTVIGALLAAVITSELSNDYVLWTLLLLFSVGQFSTKGMNFAITQALITPFIIILLNIVYPGQSQLAEVRILDVAIGGALAVVTGYIVSVRWRHIFSAQLPQIRGIHRN